MTESEFVALLARPEEAQLDFKRETYRLTGDAADADLRDAIERQWCQNRDATGGHTYDPPEWYTPPEDHCPLPPFNWDMDRRGGLRADLDAYYAVLYGLEERDLRYILNPTDVHGPVFPGKTSRVTKEIVARFGEYSASRLVLEAWERMHA